MAPKGDSSSASVAADPPESSRRVWIDDVEFSMTSCVRNQLEREIETDQNSDPEEIATWQACHPGVVENVTLLSLDCLEESSALDVAEIDRTVVFRGRSARF